MKLLICLFFLCFIYYKINQLYQFTTNYNIYFGIFILFCLIVSYLMNYQRQFMYKMAYNVNNANKIQLHELIPDYTKSNDTNNIKYTLSDKQLMRCKGCLNPIDLQYINHYKLSYTIPLQSGGHNNMSNLCLLCPTCHNQNNLNNF